MAKTPRGRETGTGRPPRPAAWLIPALLALLLAVACSAAPSPPQPPQAAPPSPRKLLPPPGGGLYLGQTEIEPGGRRTLEAALGRKIAIWARLDLVRGQEESEKHALGLNLKAAEETWEQGYLFIVGAYEAYPGHGSFTVDRLLRGEYEADLTRLAEQFKAFGHPMVFSTAREPNGVLADYMGGFGPEGDQGWEAGDLTGRFTPPPGPPGNPDLFAGLGDPTLCDGLERLAAAQRYYYDFFTRRQGIDFLTFETMGWFVPTLEDPPEGPCFDWKTFYRLLEGYADWVSLNFYLLSEASVEPPIDAYLTAFDAFMSQNVRQVAAGMPVMITELGFCGRDVPEKITRTMDHFLRNYPEIGAVVLWGDGGWDCQVTPGPEGEAFRAVLQANPDRFPTCVYLSGGDRPPGCD